MAFIPYNANPLYKDTDDCTVRAISLFTVETIRKEHTFNELVDMIKGLKASVDEWNK